MLRSIGSLVFLALLMVACSGGGGEGDSGTPPPPLPPPAAYTVGGTVTGLAGSGLLLGGVFIAGNSGSSAYLAISASGAFAFSERVNSGQTYSVAVETQPRSPTQYCSVANSSGTVATANVVNVSVTCENGYTIGGTVSGLVGSGLRLAICASANGPGPLIHCRDVQGIGANGAFTLKSVYPAGFSSSEFVVIYTQPSSPTQRCVVSGGGVGIGTANRTNVAVTCAAVAYVTDAADNTLSSYSVDATTGALAVIGPPTVTGASPSAIVGAAYFGRRFVFVANKGSNDVSAFSVNNTTGALTTVPGSPFAAGIDPKAMALPRSQYLYVANAGADTISAFFVDASTGSLTPLSPATFATGRGPSSIAVDPTGGYIYVANNGGSNDVSAFSVDASTDLLTPVAGSPYPAGANPLSLAFGAGGKFLYTANPGGTNPSISGFSIDPVSGALSPLSGSPFPLTVSHNIATDRTGAYLYVTSGANVVGYRINATTGALTSLPGFPVAAGAIAFSMTIDPLNQFLYVANEGEANISGFRLNASTGALTPVPGSTFPAGNRPNFLVTF